MLTAPGALAAPACPVPPGLWDRPRSGAAILALEPIRPCVQALLEQPGVKLTIRHAPGVEGGLQAEELRSWFVALALDPDRIDLAGDLDRREPLRLDVGRVP